MKTLIIGAGEIGKSLFKVLSPTYVTYIKDVENLDVKDIEVLNICYPMGKDFVKNTKKYIEIYKPKVTIIHSTVSPGTTELCGENVVHSPVHGKHPNLEDGIKTFIKYIGGNNPFAVAKAQKFLKGAGISTKLVANSKTSEISKILCTTYYGWNILFMKEVVEICKKYDVPFQEVYTDWNWFYNIGYEKLGMPQFKKYNLEPMDGKIGGHCVVNNCHLLKSKITDLIIKENEKY